VRPGGDIKPPTRIKYVVPIYPFVARTNKVQGIVIIEAIIGTDGKVEDAKVIRSTPLLDQAALEAVRAWEYMPTLLNGRPTPVIMTVTVLFKLN
jgi:TonB family protein